MFMLTISPEQKQKKKKEKKTQVESRGSSEANKCGEYRRQYNLA